MPNCAHCGGHVAPGARQCPTCGVTLSGRDQATLPGPGYAQAPAAADAMIGRSIIDQFVVRTKLGEGGMGAVYVADQPTVGRTAVIKVIHPWLSKDPEIAEHFAAEARAAARLQNPHIVSIYNYGKLPDGTLFLAMEHIQGPTLGELIQSKGRLDAARTVNIARQCCEALAEAHRRGVIHRDVKPSNIMLQARHQGPGFVKMLDFGVATLDDRDTGSGRTPPGTPCYMSPEQLAGETVDGRSDLYSLAVVIYEMLTGQPPFLASSPEQYARLHREVPPPAPTAIAPEIDIPPALEACLMRALAKAPHARPQSAERFADELRSAIDTTAAMAATPMPTTGHRAVPRPRPARRLVPLVGGLALVGIVVAALTLGSEDEVGPTPPPGPRHDAAASPASQAPDPVADALRRRSVAELESELERVGVLRGQGAAAVNEAMTAYHHRVRREDPGRERESTRREVLVEQILAWARAPAVGERSSIAELEAVFLRMSSPLDQEQRRDLLRALKNREAENPDHIRRRLLEWIEQHGFDYETGDPGAELVLEDDP